MSHRSSDSSDDDESEKLRSAIDPSFAVNGLGKIKPENGDPVPSSSLSNGANEKEEEWDPGHSFQTFQMTKQMKNFIAKRLEESLEKQIKVVRRKNPENHLPLNGAGGASETGIYLFTKSKNTVSQKDLENQNVSTSPLNRKGLKFKRRKVDSSESEEEDEKLKAVTVSSDWVINKTTL